MRYPITAPATGEVHQQNGYEQAEPKRDRYSYVTARWRRSR